jgi:hypothetical protein
MSFLPKEYNVPETPSPYMKFKDGVNRFRILSPAIVGYEYWNTNKKPVRQEKPFDTLPADIQTDKDGMPTSIKHFWAFVVWNYEEKMVQILEITQSTIQRGLKIKIDNRSGKATENDFIITKSGKDLLTEYDIDVAEASPLAPEIEAAYKAKNINLEALFTGADPFAAGDNKQAVAGQTEGSPTNSTEDSPF